MGEIAVVAGMGDRGRYRNFIVFLANPTLRKPSRWAAIGPVAKGGKGEGVDWAARVQPFVFTCYLFSSGFDSSRIGLWASEGLSVGMQAGYALRVLHSMLFANIRNLAGARTLAHSSAGNRRACFEVAVGAFPRHWGFLVGTDPGGFAAALENAGPSGAEIEEALRARWIDDEFAERLEEPFRLDVNAPPDGSLLFERDPVVTVEGPLWQAWLAAHWARAWFELPCVVATRAARLTMAAGKMGVMDATSSSIVDPELAVRVARAAHVGGLRSTQNAVAASRLGIKLRITKPPEALSLAEEAEVVADRGWTFRSTAVGAVAHLGPGDDEEETLADLQRHGLQAAEWASRGIAILPVGLRLRVDLVAMEQDGVWVSRLGAIPDMTVIPGRKLVVRYFDRTGQPIADLMHGVAERVSPPEEAMLMGHLDVPTSIPIVGATTCKPVLEPLLRGGHGVGMGSSVDKARAELRSALQMLPAAYARLRYPARFPVGYTRVLADMKASLVAMHAS